LEALTCRLLPDTIAGGPHQMAVDEVMLEGAAQGIASFRFYRWQPATVSLGYFRPERDRAREPDLTNLPFVRRPSGGALLVHDRELTYAFALPPGLPWQRRADRASAWLERMHEMIRLALGDLGIDCAAAEHPIPSAAHDALCFLNIARGDLLLKGHKVVGSAQRRHRGALLQHGAILLGTSPHTPMLPGIGELNGRHLVGGDLRDAVCRRLVRSTAWNLRPVALDPTESLQVEHLTRTKYGSRAWNCKR
jgi:lipoate-protein ligase A